MSPSTATLRDLGRSLVDLEAGSIASGGAAQVCEKFRFVLTKLAGVAGYHSLISRAVATAKADAPALQNVSVNSDGSIKGLEEAEDTDFDATVTLVAHLLYLLVTFVGEPLMLSLVGAAWPQFALRRNIAEEEL